MVGICWGGKVGYFSKSDRSQGTLKSITRFFGIKRSMLFELFYDMVTRCLCTKTVILYYFIISIKTTFISHEFIPRHVLLANKNDGKVSESVGIFFGKTRSSKTFKTMVPASRSRCMLISTASTDRPPGVQTTMGEYEPSGGGARDILANHPRSRIVGAYGVAQY